MPWPPKAARGSRCGTDLLDRLEKGLSPQEALDQVVAADEAREPPVGVIDGKGRSAQWTGKNQCGAEKQGDWVHMRKGATYAMQGNSLVSPKVVDAVAESFQASEGSLRALADRLIDALAAGRTLGGDGRHGETHRRRCSSPIPGPECRGGPTASP